MLSILSRSRVVRTNLALVTVAIAAACGSDTPVTPPPAAKDVTPASIVSDINGTLTGVAGTQLGTVLSVSVTNKAGEALDTIPVVFAVTAGGGTVGSPSVRTSAGKATTTWTLGATPGTQTVTATVSGLPPVTFTATATAGAASKITKLSTDPQTAVAGANVASAPSVKVTDANNNPVANVLVTFNVASGGGSVTGGLANTDANGVATAGSWKLGGTVGTNTLTATANGIATPVTFTATGTVGAASALTISNTAPTLNVGQTFTLTTTARDANGNQISNAAIGWTTSNAAVATVSSTGVVTGVGSGTATITATLGTLTATQVVSVIGHPTTLTTSTTVAMGSTITGVSVVGNTAYVGEGSGLQIGIVDIPSATITGNVDLGFRRPNDVAASATIIAAPTSSPNVVWFINPAGTRTDSLELPANGVKAVMNAAGTKLFVDMDNFSMAVIDIASRTFSTIAVPGAPAGLKMGAGDSLVYFGTQSGQVFVIDAATGTLRQTINTGFPLRDIAIGKDGKTLFAVDGTTNLHVVPIVAGGIDAMDLTLGGPLSAVATSPDGSQVWVGYPGNLIIAPLFPNNGGFDIYQNVKMLGINPIQIVFSPLGSSVVIADSGFNQLIIFK